MELYNPEYGEWEELSKEEESSRVRINEEGITQYYNLEYGEWFDAKGMIKRRQPDESK